MKKLLLYFSLAFVLVLSQAFLHSTVSGEEDADSNEEDPTYEEVDEVEDEESQEEQSEDEENSDSGTSTDETEQEETDHTEEDATEESDAEDTEESDESHEETESNEEESDAKEEESESSEEETEELEEEEQEEQEKEEEENEEEAQTFGTQSVQEQYTIGDEGDHVVEMKQKLVDMGFVSWNPPSRFYGSITASYVEEFQAYYGMDVTGVADEATRNKMDEVLNAPYKNGDRGVPVVELKEKLVELEFAGWSSPSQFYGSITAGVVEDFQAAYNLEVTGVADQNTLATIEQALTRFTPGDEGEHVVEMKQKLVDMGFVSWNPPSRHYGSITASYVSEFQEYYNLPVTGNADRTTREKMDEVLSSPYQDGDRGEPVVVLKEKLVELGFANWSSPSQFYGSITSGVVADFQSYYGLSATGVADGQTLNKLDDVLNSQYSIGDRGQHVVELKEKLVTLGFANWSSPSASYGPITAGVVEDFQQAYGLPVSGIADPLTRETMEDNIVKIFIDPGHGGRDPGAIGFGLTEKYVNLDISLKMKQFLENKYRGADIMLTRTTDEYHALESRSVMANEWGADYFVGVHNNAFNGNMHGFETFIHNGSVSSETVQHQRNIHTHVYNEMRSDGISDRGMKRSNFNVLRNTDMPAILFEYLFIDNRSEYELLRNSSYRTHLAEITADAIANSFNLSRK
ncbi:peptidoglycan-binding protein [Halalkalibacillus halophilus]|uniref:peptidoglycan-binding protein n=1 Tax=Halalkalibacillus halophilus TaxID=392827 RepID=UPI000416AC6B|nr:peptidoglycan-binding protein [Halalkalibacillus halophilus]